MSLAAIFARSLRPLLVLSLLSLTACSANYAVPGNGADMSLFGKTDEARLATDPSIREVLDRKPLAHFPTNVAIARVEGPGYCSYTGEGYGRGRYSVVTYRDVEKDEHLQHLRKLPYVNGVAPMSKLLLPARLTSDMQLRRVAATLHADVLLIYTIDTTFRNTDKPQPLNLIALGLFNDREFEVTTTASAVIMDTRSGYVYAVAEGTENQRHAASAWTDERKVDNARKEVESAAFDKLVGELETAWNNVVQQYAGATPATTTTSAPTAPTAAN